MGNVIGGLLGGNSGVGYKPQAANIQTPVTNQQAGDAYTNASQGLNNQQQLLSALQGQNGIQNQSNVFNQMSNVAAGQGPNPAQAMLANTTGQNIASQAALMAGQRGAGQNAGLLARQAAMQGGNLQQQAAGQGAALQAQQSLSALGQMGGLSTNQVNQQQNAVNAYTNAAQSEQQNLLNAIAQQNNANVNMQGNMNTVGGNLAGTVAGGQMGGLGGLFNSAGGLSGIASGIGDAAKAFGGLFSGAAASMPAMAGGAADAVASNPEVLMAAEGGEIEDQPETPIPTNNTPLIASQGATSGPKSSLGKMLSSSPSPDNYALADKSIAPKPGTLMARGGKVPALVSPGERYLPPKEVDKVAEGKKSPMKAGEKIPGKPKVAGDKNSYKNDTIPKTLEEGGIVLPRSVTQAKDPALAAHQFVTKILAKEGRK